MKSKAMLVSLMERGYLRAALSVFCQEVERASLAISEAGCIETRSSEVAKLDLREMWERLFDDMEVSGTHMHVLATVVMQHHSEASQVHSQFFRDVVHLFSAGWLDEMRFSREKIMGALEWHLCRPLCEFAKKVPATSVN